MKLFSKKRLQSVIGLSITDGQLRVAHAARAKSAVAVMRSTTAPLSLDLFHPETELVGREIKNHLEAAQIRERHCVVAVPASWLMSQHTKMPAELSLEDQASLLQIEAEKSFPCGLDELQVANSAHGSAESGYVTQLAIRHEQLARLTAVLKSAGLKPVSYTLGLDALPGAIPPAGEGRITLVLEPKGATLLIAAGGGIAAFRTFEAAIDSEAGENVVNGAALARELRITFEQVPADLRQQVKELRLLGDDKIARQLEEVLADWAKDAGLTIQRSAGTRTSIAEEIVEHVATRQLKEGAPQLEFLPPRPSRWSLMMARYSSKRLATAGFAAAAVAVIVLAAFGWQEYRRWSLRNEWSGMAVQVKSLDEVTGRIREFRPWYDTSYRNLTIIKRVVECFPDAGMVSAKTFEIHGVSGISVTGTARDQASILRVQEELQKVKEIQGLKVEQMRGKTPVQFTLTFRWNANSGT
jgi:hypothetical protein